jgi:hypothetical protein
VEQIPYAVNRGWKGLVVENLSILTYFRCNMSGVYYHLSLARQFVLLILTVWDFVDGPLAPPNVFLDGVWIYIFVLEQYPGP